MSTAAPSSLRLSADSPNVKLDLRLVLALAAVWIIWGSTYLAMRVAVEGLPPFLMAGTRFVLAGSILLAFVRLRGGALPSRRDWIAAMPIGGLLFLVGNGFVVVAEQTLPSSVAAVVCATTPLVATGLVALRGERPRFIEVVGMVFGIVGVALLGIGSPLNGAGIRSFLVLLAPVGWSIGSLIARARDTKASPIASAGAQMFMGGVWMLGAAIVLGEHMPSVLPWKSVAAWVYLVLCGSVVGFSAYSWLLRNARPAVAMSYAYVNPIIAVLLGAALGGETLGWATLLATVLIAGGIVAAVVLGRRKKALPRLLDFFLEADSTIWLLMELPGPRGPIRVERDSLGYPTIWARDLNEATWARGYMHATDRLVQIHLVMAAARGELLSIVGERRFARTVDRAVRALGLVTDLDEQVQQLRPDTRAWLDRYCEGFNAGARKRGTPALLRMLGRPVEIYTPKSILTVYRLVTFFGLTSMQQTAEMVIAELIARGAPRAVFDALLGDAAGGLDLDKLKDLHVNDDYAMLGALPIGGSNAFAISGKASRTGGAILMGEFHMEVGRIPPVLYASHVQYPNGSFYQGMGIPGFAWNSAGRTDKIAWSYTFGHADNVDIVAERCQDEKREVAAGWEPLSKRVERVRVRGKKTPETWTFYDCAYGTVLGDASKPGTYPCMRWSGRGELHADLDTTLDSMSTRNVAECIAVQRRFKMLSLQAVFADTDGVIGEVHLGRVDARPHGWSGAYPFPGWERDGTAPPADEEMRPPPTHGVDRIVSANNRAPGGPGARWATLPEPHDRFDRITELLENVDDADGMVRVSYDAFDGSAARLCEVWGPHLPDDAEARALVEWAKTQRDRSRLGLFHALHLEASRAILERWMGEREASRIVDDLCAVLLFQYHLDRVLSLEKPDLLDAKGLRAVLARAWPRAKVSPARAALPIVRRFHDAVTQGKLGSALGWCSKPVMFPGAPCAPFQTRSFRFEDEALVFGPAFHYLTDMSRRGGWYHLPGGASERRTGPGYAKGIDLWAEGRFLPLGPKDGDPPRPPPRK